MPRNPDLSAKSAADQIVNILASNPHISLHDFTGEELVVYIKIPPGKSDMREMAAEWIASSIQDNLGRIIQHAIAIVVVKAAMDKIQKEVG
ncbi:MAG TPA: hypothetical protein DD789_06695 [Firmicutes bacterium]|jgi:hypothetical protein|nr:hypothetical protein [Bacillota bacterium]